MAVKNRKYPQPSTTCVQDHKQTQWKMETKHEYSTQTYSKCFTSGPLRFYIRLLVNVLFPDVNKSRSTTKYSSWHKMYNPACLYSY
jgi:hypothetical protein